MKDSEHTQEYVEHQHKSRDRQTDRQAGRQAGRQTDRQTDRDRDRDTETETETQRGREEGRERYLFFNPALPPPPSPYLSIALLVLLVTGMLPPDPFHCISLKVYNCVIAASHTLTGDKMPHIIRPDAVDWPL